jgi:hypothetical protein
MLQHEVVLLAVRALLPGVASHAQGADLPPPVKEAPTLTGSWPAGPRAQQADVEEWMKQARKEMEGQNWRAALPLFQKACAYNGEYLTADDWASYGTVPARTWLTGSWSGSSNWSLPCGRMDTAWTSPLIHAG